MTSQAIEKVEKFEKAQVADEQISSVIHLLSIVPYRKMSLLVFIMHRAWGK